MYRTFRWAWMSLVPSNQNIINLTVPVLDEGTSMTCEEEQETAFLVIHSRGYGQCK